MSKAIALRACVYSRRSLRAGEVFEWTHAANEHTATERESRSFLGSSLLRTQKILRKSMEVRDGERQEQPEAHKPALRTLCKHLKVILEHTPL